MNITTNALALAGLGALLSAHAADLRATEASIPTYRAHYLLEYKGKHVGSTEIAVTFDGTIGSYRYQSTSNFRGLLRLVSPEPVVERSDFLYVDGRIRPLEFWHEDGTRRGEGNLHVVFDWERSRATTTGDGWTVEFDLSPDALDRGSMQVAVMLDMAAGDGPGRYVLADEDSLKTYEYTADGEMTLQTALGMVDTQRFLRQRRGSSRRTLLWSARALAFLPVRIEQQRDGETRTALQLQSVEWLDGGEHQ